MGIEKFAIYFGGVLNSILIVFHIMFSKLFDWPNDLKKLSPINSRIMVTLNFALILLFALFSLLSFIYTDEMVAETGLGFALCLMYGFFWVWRAAWQVYYFKPPKGEKTGIHLMMIAWFLLLAAAYFVPVFI